MSGKAGYRRPPKHTQFRPGRSGNPRGRPKRRKAGTDIAALLTEPIMVTEGGVERAMHSFEAALRRMLRRAVVDRELRAVRTFLNICAKYGALSLESGLPPRGQVLTIPKTWDPDEWKAMFLRYGPPPWPGKRSGLPDDPPEEA